MPSPSRLGILRRVNGMIRIATSTVLVASVAWVGLALTVPCVEARGRGLNDSTFSPRVGAWGRPLGPVRSGAGSGWRDAGPDFVPRSPHHHHRWHGPAWGYGYGLAGFGLGWGIGSMFGDLYGPYGLKDEFFVRPVEVEPIETEHVVVQTESEVAPADLSAAVAACARRFKTYDPASQTYVGRGYVRRHCP